MEDDPEDGPVGYKRPPSHSRFRKGQSGNPRGRRRGSGVRSAAEKVLDRKVTVTVDGKRQKLPITEALMLQLTQKALADDSKAIRDVLKISDQAALSPDPKDRAPLVILHNVIDPKDCNPALDALGVIIPVGERYKIAPWVVDAAMARSPRLGKSDPILIANSTLKPGEKRLELSVEEPPRDTLLNGTGA